MKYALLHDIMNKSLHMGNMIVFETPIINTCPKIKRVKMFALHFIYYLQCVNENIHSALVNIAMHSIAETWPLSMTFE